MSDIDNSSRPLVEVRDLRKYFEATHGLLRKVVGTVKAVDGVSFSIQQGETLALVGESGCGKTTTGRCLIRAVDPSAGSIRYSFDNADPIDIATVDKHQLRELRRSIRLMFQDPYSSLNPRMTVFQIISEPLLINKLVQNQSEARDRVQSLLQMVHLNPNKMDRYPHAFSGGQRQRIAIARALAPKPRFLIADEPVSALDVSVQAQVLNLLKDLQHELRGLTYLFVAHNLSVVKYQSDRVAIMYVGKIVELTVTEELFLTPKHPYTEALISAAPDPEPRAVRRKKRIVLAGEVANPADPPSGCYFHPRCRYAKDVCRTTEPPLRDIGTAQQPHQVACHFAEELTLRGIE
ncbi:MAG: ATP-binding cassette domain-containing protein [Spirochaetaceae bacterium]|nr:MAG: ATP-binding cassette domain-containing protein [Spirochaetaceae bacterium]